MKHAPHPLVSRRSGALSGTITPPGDKSISHRAVMLGGIASGVTTVRGLLEGEDVLRTIAALQALGATISREDNGSWRIEGCGLDNLNEPAGVLDMGNSGTSVRLLIGLLATRRFASFFTGDASLNKRPMERVMTPLRQMGAEFVSRGKGRLPLAVIGAAQPHTISYRLPVASAQVKSAILLAGLSASGVTTVIESAPTRDHSERMLKAFGATVNVEDTPDGEAISIVGQPALTGQNITVPADISSAAFPLVAALLRPNSSVTLLNVGINPRRDGIIRTLREMGADIQLINQREASGEPVADIVAKGSALKGVTVPAERAPSMIDEYPALAMAAACADGVTRMCGLGEMRVKESDRLTLVAQGLRDCGANVVVDGDDLIVTGNGNAPRGGATIETALDHRIAMSFLVLGAATPDPIRVDDGTMINTSFPAFTAMMNGLGTDIAAN